MMIASCSQNNRVSRSQPERYLKALTIPELSYRRWTIVQVPFLKNANSYDCGLKTF
jgi:hypothetical protein